MYTVWSVGDLHRDFTDSDVTGSSSIVDLPRNIKHESAQMMHCTCYVMIPNSCSSTPSLLFYIYIWLNASQLVKPSNATDCRVLLQYEMHFHNVGSYIGIQVSQQVLLLGVLHYPCSQMWLLVSSPSSVPGGATRKAVLHLLMRRVCTMKLSTQTVYRCSPARHTSLWKK